MCTKLCEQNRVNNYSHVFGKSCTKLCEQNCVNNYSHDFDHAQARPCFLCVEFLTRFYCVNNYSHVFQKSCTKLCEQNRVNNYSHDKIVWTKPCEQNCVKQAGALLSTHDWAVAARSSFAWVVPQTVQRKHLMLTLTLCYAYAYIDTLKRWYTDTLRLRCHNAATLNPDRTEVPHWITVKAFNGNA